MAVTDNGNTYFEVGKKVRWIGILELLISDEKSL